MRERERGERKIQRNTEIERVDALNSLTLIFMGY